MHILNGNRITNLKIMHWNLGNKFWKRKVEEIQLLTIDEKPDFLFISEANLFSIDEDYEIRVTGYELNHSKTWQAFNYSRLVLLAREGLQYSIEERYMDEEISSIWICIGGRGRKRTMRGGVYREHWLLKQANKPDSADPDSQVQRWRKFTQQCMEAEKNSTCLIIGDTNIDHLKWGAPDNGHIALTDLMKNVVEILGFSQLVVNATRFWPETEPSLVDQICCNQIDRITNVKT